MLFVTETECVPLEIRLEAKGRCEHRASSMIDCERHILTFKRYLL
jgi:hypothetical protein